MTASLTAGLIAGAAGTVALDAASFADMALRGRPASASQATLVQKAAERAGVQPLGDPAAGEATANRRTGLGSLAGYAVGLGVGALYGALRPAARGRIPWLVGALAVGAAAMAAADIPLTRLGVTDPAQWGAADWASDVIPHALYGLTVAAVFESIAS